MLQNVVLGLVNLELRDHKHKLLLQIMQRRVIGRELRVSLQLLEGVFENIQRGTSAFLA